MATAQASVCPVVGTTTTVLPPHHPDYDHTDPEARCPITNAKVGHHGDEIIHNHPTDDSIPSEDAKAMDAKSCPALKKMKAGDKVVDATCPVVGPVSAMLPPSHPAVEDGEAGKVCPVTNATLEHHKNKVHVHPSVPSDASAEKCPVAGAGAK